MLTSWQASSILVKLIFNLSGLIAVGNILFGILLPQVPTTVRLFSQKLTAVCAIVALVAAVLSFQLNVAIFSDSGFFGLFDVSIIKILLTTNVGHSTLLRLVALILIGLSAFQLRSGKIFSLLGVMIFIFSFLLLGHTVARGWFISMILALHLLSVSFWVGSLWPLHQLCKHADTVVISQLMSRFGHIAIAWVSLLLISGLTLLWALLPSMNQLINSTYGQILSIKILMVLLLLSLALLNKMVLVPKLWQVPITKAIKRLRSVITLEMGIVVLILFVTSVMTTVVGPR